MKFRLLPSKRVVQIVHISFGLVRKRVAKWPFGSFCYGAYIYILQRWQARPGKKDTPGRRGAKPPDSIEQGAKPPVR